MSCALTLVHSPSGCSARSRLRSITLLKVPSLNVATEESPQLWVLPVGAPLSFCLHSQLCLICTSTHRQLSWVLQDLSQTQQQSSLALTREMVGEAPEAC